ncbi:MAG: DUF721 domain-containing protein [Bacteroidetes bacterium]|nr:DUF721 domain-containing protein [Bacteroidota bacterium]
MSTHSLAQALQLYLKESRVGDQIQALQIQDAWETLVGKTIARYTDSVRLQGDKLFIHTQVGPLRNELQFQRSTIRQKVNEWLGSPVVREVIIQ